MIASRAKAKEGLINREGMEELKKKVEAYIEKVRATDVETIKKYSVTEAIEVRNHLMATATLRLGRRSKELLTMNLDEMEKAKVCEANGERYFIVYVSDQKGKRAGNPAAVTFSSGEFDVLRLFITHLRPKLTQDSEMKCVFPPKDGLITNKTMAFSSATSILKKFETESGKKLTSRVGRRSTITNSRDVPLTNAQVKDLASSMNHTVATAERYYNFKDIFRCKVLLK